MIGIVPQDLPYEAWACSVLSMGLRLLYSACLCVPLLCTDVKVIKGEPTEFCVMQCL